MSNTKHGLRSSLKAFRHLLRSTWEVRANDLPEGSGMDDEEGNRPPQVEYLGYDPTGVHLWTLYISREEVPVNLFFTTTEGALRYYGVCRTCNEYGDDPKAEHLKVLLTSGVKITPGPPLPEGYEEDEDDYFAACCEDCRQSGGFGTDFFRRLIAWGKERDRVVEEALALPAPPRKPLPS